MRLQPGAAGDAGQHEAPLLALVRLGQLGQRLLDPLDRLLQQLGQQLGRQGLHRHQQDGLDRAAQLGVLHGLNPSPFVVVDLDSPPSSASPRPLATPASSSAASHEIRRSPKVAPCPSDTRPILHSSSRARKRTITSMRVRQSCTSARKEPARVDSGMAISSATASDTDTVSTVTWERSTRGTGRSADPRR